MVVADEESLARRSEKRPGGTAPASRTAPEGKEGLASNEAAQGPKLPALDHTVEVDTDQAQRLGVGGYQLWALGDPGGRRARWKASPLEGKPGGRQARSIPCARRLGWTVVRAASRRQVQVETGGTAMRQNTAAATHAAGNTIHHRDLRSIPMTAKVTQDVVAMENVAKSGSQTWVTS